MTVAAEAPREVAMDEIEFGAEIGQGSGSTVYAAVFEGKKVAAKRPRITCAADLKNFGVEAALLSKFVHPNVIHLIACCNKLCLILELMERGPLFEILHIDGHKYALELPLKLSLALDIARGLEYLHSQGFVHGDLKSANVLVNSSWQAKISDLESAAHASQLVPDIWRNRAPSRPSGGKRMGQVGTPLWMAPEVINKEPRTAASDVYSFGVLLNELLAGQIPYSDRPHQLQTTVLLNSIVTEGRRPTLAPDLPAPLPDLIAACFRAEPAARPSAAALAEALAALAAAHPLPALLPQEPLPPAPKPAPVAWPAAAAGPSGSGALEEIRGNGGFAVITRGNLPVTLRELAGSCLTDPDALPVIAEVFSSQGPRRQMEDRHVILKGLRGRPSEHLFAVFDGHGGYHAAEFAAQHLPATLLADPQLDADPVVRPARPAPSGAAGPDAAQGALKRAFLATDSACMEEQRRLGLEDGTTALVALLRGETLYVANAGDCRAVVCRGGRGSTKPLAVPLSEDHKASRSDEQERIRSRGGYVKLFTDENKWRAQGALDTTRCIGDGQFKPFLTAEPDVVVHRVERGVDDFLILASDGLWDTMSSQESVDYVNSTARDPLMCAKRLASETYEKTPPSTDNVSVIVVFFRELSTCERVYADAPARPC